MHLSGTLLGAAVFVAILIAITQWHARLWRCVSACYGRPLGTPTARRLDTVVLAQRGGNYRHHTGAFIGVGPQGLSFSVIPIPPLNTGCPPFFLPFEELN